MTRLIALADWFDRVPRWLAIVIAVSIWYVLYLPPAVFPIRQPTQWPMLAFETRIPFVAWAIVPYLSVFLLILVALILLPKGVVGRAIVGSILLECFHFVVFFLFPAEFPRTGLSPPEGWKWLVDLVWSIDRPNNCFPSLHVSVAFLASFSMARASRPGGAVLFLWTILIALSTLATHQHYVLDVAAGFIAAACCYLVVFHVLAPEHAEGRLEKETGRV